MAQRKQLYQTAGQVDMSRLPRHIAIIMDGNGRWAKKRGLPRTAGHKVGAETFRKVAKYCKRLGVPYLTVYAFSTENWRRPKEEVDTIMGLLERYLHEAIDSMARENIKLCFLGDLSAIPAPLRALIDKAEAISRELDSPYQANICLNYGGRDEILHAARAIAEAGESFTEENLQRHLYSAAIPDPDLLIRPGGEQRISNFLLWQAAYSEFYFCDTLWPDFDEAELDRAIIAYQSRDRRFGGVK